LAFTRFFDEIGTLPRSTADRTDQDRRVPQRGKHRRPASRKVRWCLPRSRAALWSNNWSPPIP